MNAPPSVVVFDPPTVMKGRRYEMKSNSELMFKGGAVPRHRRQFIVTSYGAVAPSTNAAIPIQIRSNGTGLTTSATEPDDGLSVILWGKTSISLFTNADIVIRNGNDAAPVSVTVCEIFYA
jgi:hypothetical protein